LGWGHAPAGPWEGHVTEYPRDLVGYGATPPDPRWPGGARLALQIVVNYEEGSEYTILDGDGRTEVGLAESPGGRAPKGVRDLAMESMYEYGSRVGFWRLFQLFTERQVPITVFACALALERNSAVARAIADAGLDVCCHGWRWIEHFQLTEAEEREHIRRAVDSLTQTTGSRPLGWYCRYGPSVHTRRLLLEEGGFVYDSDAYNDELPYWVIVGGRPHLVVPYTLDANDGKFCTPAGIGTGNEFFTYLRETFDVLYREGARGPRMMSVGLHCRLAGRPARADGLARFLDHVQRHEGVWICRRIDIARHWHAQHPFRA
jgi:allantoinase